MNIFIVIIEDRHADVEAVPFISKDAAIAHAQNVAKERARRPVDFQEGLTDRMVKAGWLYYGTFSVEGDGVWVVERELGK